MTRFSAYRAAAGLPPAAVPCDLSHELRSAVYGNLFHPHHHRAVF
jgi:hypothetical protein